MDSNTVHRASPQQKPSLASAPGQQFLAPLSKGDLLIVAFVACRAHGKFAGAGFVTDETLLRRYISMGARLILPGSDLNMMVRAATEAPRQCAIASDLAARRMTRSLAVSAHAEPTSRTN